MVESKHNPAAPVPTGLIVHQQSHMLEICYEDGATFHLPFEFLRVQSPSAEVQGHGPGQEILQTGKRNVEVTAIDSVGNYGVKPYFSDGHNTGIFTWEYLYWLGTHQPELWQNYLAQLTAAGFTPDSGRDAPMQDRTAKAHGCGT